MVLSKTRLRRKLRHASTSAEKLFWSKVCAKQFLSLKFRRQHHISSYVVDFYCPAKRLVIEIDGPSHFTKESIEYDIVRSKYFEGLGIKVLRFKNSEVSTGIRTCPSFVFCHSCPIKSH